MIELDSFKPGNRKGKELHFNVICLGHCRTIPPIGECLEFRGLWVDEPATHSSAFPVLDGWCYVSYSLQHLVLASVGQWRNL